MTPPIYEDDSTVSHARNIFYYLMYTVLYYCIYWLYMAFPFPSSLLSYISSCHFPSICYTSFFNDTFTTEMGGGHFRNQNTLGQKLIFVQLTKANCDFLDFFGDFYFFFIFGLFGIFWTFWNFLDFLDFFGLFGDFFFFTF